MLEKRFNFVTYAADDRTLIFFKLPVREVLLFLSRQRAELPQTDLTCVISLSCSNNKFLTGAVTRCSHKHFVYGKCLGKRALLFALEMHFLETYFLVFCTKYSKCLFFLEEKKSFICWLKMSDLTLIRKNTSSFARSKSWMVCTDI